MTEYVYVIIQDKDSNGGHSAFPRIVIRSVK